MNRRDFLRTNSSICAGWALFRAMPALPDTPSAGEWRTFEVVTKVELLKPNGISYIWLPAPLIRNTPYQNTISTRFTAKKGTAKLSKDEQSALGIVSAMYAANAKSTLSLTSRVALKNYAVDLSSRATAPPLHRLNWTTSFGPADMCRLERSVCRPGPLGGLAGAACLWIADREIRPGLQVPWTGHRYSNEGTALSRGSLPARAWLGACGPSRCPESSFGRTSRESSVER